MLLWIKSLNFVVVFCILFLPILLSYVAKLGSVFLILVEGGLPLNALLERCLDFIIDFHLLFLLWVPLSSFSAEHSWSLKVSRRASIFCCSACWFTYTYVFCRSACRPSLLASFLYFFDICHNKGGRISSHGFIAAWTLYRVRTYSPIASWYFCRR